MQVSTPGSGDSYLRVTTSERGSKQWYEIKGTQTIDSYDVQITDLFKGLVEAKKEGYSISSVTIWAVSDNFSWKNWNYPVLFNADLSTKPAFDALVTLGLEYQLEDAKEALNDKITKLEQLDSALYTEDSYAAFKAELDRVKSEASGSLTLEDAESLLAALETAETGLVTKLDAAKEELNNKIAELEAMDLSDYTEESAAAFRAASLQRMIRDLL